MVSLKGLTLKKIQQTVGMEGYGLIADVYINGKKIGEYADYADGAMGNMSYVSKEAEEIMMHLVYAFGKEHPNDFIVNMYKQDPAYYDETLARIKQYFPYIRDDELCLESVSANDVDYIVEAYMTLRDYEKAYKKAIRKGYASIGIAKDKIYYFPARYTDEMIRNEGCSEIFRNVEDFKIA